MHMLKKIGLFFVLCFFPFLNLGVAHMKVSFEEDFSLPIVYLNLVLEVGSLHDSPQKLGLANIATEMLLRGTKKQSKEVFLSQLEQLGASLDAIIYPEGVVLHAAVLSENTEKFLSMLEETFLMPLFLESELKKLKKEVEGQILEQKGNDKQLVSLNFSRFFYGTHPYGNPVLGTQKTVAALTKKDVSDFYSQYFHPQNLSFFGSGALEKNRIEKWYQSFSEKLSKLNSKSKKPGPIAEPVIPKEKRILIVDKPKTTQTQILMGGVGFRPEDVGFYSIQLANHSFGGSSFAARMMQELRVKRGWTYGAYNSFKFGKTHRHFAMYFFPKNEDSVPAIKLALELFADFLNKGITKEEFEFAKKSLVNNSPFNYDTSKKRLDNATQEHLLSFPNGYFKDFSSKIESVDFAEIPSVLKKSFNPEQLTLVVVGDAAMLKKDTQSLPGFKQTVVKNYLED